MKSYLAAIGLCISLPAFGASCSAEMQAVDARAASGSYKTMTAREVARLDGLQACRASLDGVTGKVMAMRLDVASKVDAGTISANQGDAIIKLRTAQIESEAQAALGREFAAYHAQQDAAPEPPKANPFAIFKVIGDALKPKPGIHCETYGNTTDCVQR